VSLQRITYTAGSYSWSVPATIINGFVTATVYGSPGQWPGGGAGVGDGLGGRIQGNIPVIAGTDSFDIAVADGGAFGFGGAFGLNHGGRGGTGPGTGLEAGWGGVRRG
jgi:hypothetical protein